MRTKKLIRKCIRWFMPYVKMFFLPYYYYSNPPKFNRILNEYEAKQGKRILQSYPVNLGINISNICNQKCRFCFHNNKKMKSKNWLDAELFQKMKWLRFISTIQLFAGNGDPLTNPNFPEIVRTVRRVASKSQLSIFTNGLALNGSNLKAAIQNLDVIHISLNAANRHTYESIIEHGNYDLVMQNLRKLSKKRPEKLQVEFSLILMRNTKDDIEPMIDLASELNFQRVIVCHFITTILDDQEFGERESMKKELPKEQIEKLVEYAKEKGVKFYFPTTITPPENCLAPWTAAYITNDSYGDRIFIVCCSGIETNLYVGPSVYTDFKKVWNSPLMQHIRETVNLESEQQNNLCYLCKKLDRADPEWQIKIRELASDLEEVEFTHDAIPKAFPKEVVA